MRNALILWLSQSRRYMTSNFSDGESDAKTDEQAAKCLNCGADLDGKYCAACGQKKVDRRDLSIRRFFGHVLNELTDLQSNKILRTFGALLFKPGQLTSEYLAGRERISHRAGAAVPDFQCDLFSVRLGSAVRCSRWRRPRGSVEPRWSFRWRSERVSIHKLLAARISDRAERIAAVLRFLSVLVSGVFLSLLYFAMRRYYVEHLIFSFHYYAFDFLCKSLFAVLFLAGRCVRRASAVDGS